MRERSLADTGVCTDQEANVTTAITNLIALPERFRLGDFVLRLSEGVSDEAAKAGGRVGAPSSSR